jgi:hypothetical protein
MNHGDPIRFAFVGSTGATSKAMLCFLPGSNTPYTPQPTDFFYLTSLVANEDVGSAASGSVVVVSSTGISYAQVAASTLLAIMGLGGGSADSFWHEGASEAFGPPQGVVPSVVADPSSSTYNLFVSGTGFVVHSPGYTQPWQKTAVAGGEIPHG